MIFLFPVRVSRTVCTYSQIYFLHTTSIGSSKSVNKKYSDTICLPKTGFPGRLEGKKRVERDLEIVHNCKFNKMYDWQRENRSGTEYVLHDGPPYANGPPHIGHAVNKILKDITIRYKCSQGHKINYITGWDCHGLPIELKAVKGGENLTPIKIREIAGKFANESLNFQKTEFSKWGILTNWNNFYRTMDAEYVKTQLKTFNSIQQKGLIFRDYMPVYWSPSSKTALAEAELEYNPAHLSTSIYLRFKLSKMSEKFRSFHAQEVYALIWTTTPWSIVANQAICYNEKEAYSVLQHGTSLYIVASKLVKDNNISLALSGAKVVAELRGVELADCEYTHPLYPGELRRFLPGDHVTSSSGTGLVHTAPAHGPDDFKIGLAHNLPLGCLVDEDGKYIESVGSNLAGLLIMGDGTKKVLDLLASDILLQQEYTHSYPYDWRTKKPVFLRASKQWFVNTNMLKEKALEAVKKVKIQPASAVKSFQIVIEKRPYWCISRQRVWGTPIPVIYDKKTDSPVVNDKLIDRYCALVDSNGPGFWWTMDIKDVLEGTGLDPDQFRLGADILDIWFDSGVSWAAVLGDKTADLYLEGLDQYSGWFYTSLLTSVALRGEAPYKEISVHGFTLDEEGNKMSKSVGNVLAPKDVMEGTKKKPALGVDVLRWWVGLHASTGSSVLVGNNILAASQSEINKIRNSLRFFLGMLNNVEPCDLLEYKDLNLIDKILLHKLALFQEKVHNHYEEKEYNKVCLAVLGFITEISATHIHLCKDRLYCDAEKSFSRRSGLTSLYLACQGFLGVLSPIVPHLAEEAAYTVSVLKSPTEVGWFSDQQWLNKDLQKCIDIIENLRDEINKTFNKPGDMRINLKVPGDELAVLSQYPVEQIAEVLGVLRVNFTPSQIQEVCVIENSSTQCARCRRLCADAGQDLCTRCNSVLST